MEYFLPKAVRVRVPPVKTQGIKTKLVPLILSSIKWDGKGRWVEPFLGSGVVGFNVRPQQGLGCDANTHIIDLYKAINEGKITSQLVRKHLEREGEILLRNGEKHYYKIRERFNSEFEPLDFLFLNRSCFNGMIRFNKRGKFNVPFCRKPNRFRPAYVTKICNQVEWLSDVFAGGHWEFKVQDWRDTLSSVKPDDFVYLDPPYVGRHTDYYTEWDDQNADALALCVTQLPCGFGYSMWAENIYRKNDHLTNWFSNYPIFKQSHFYHVGSTEALRNEMEEALVVSHSHAVNGLDHSELISKFQFDRESEAA